ncbi:RNA 2',3'-cyclic phosphodiesterase [Candidatus Pacearchaeota archaeon ex4484_26]|nr:MAG: RNA 2',3'-cyclic phosphodiesterase [Candidatus Pacearchaeota archaeon ex4484_26]RLG13195.1 MAG: RNA 2',3'-cyclic phosphodiesterase [Candidatus Pacearchaeota archaeon]
MRCFIAIDIPEELRGTLAKVQEAFKIPGLKAKFVEKENFHLTLKFLGELTDTKINSIKEKLQSIKFNSFKASFGQIGVFPSENYVRVIWLSLEPEEKFKKLAFLINQALPFGDKRFASHVTFARVKMLTDKKALQKKLQKLRIPKASFEVRNFKLKKSILMKGGPVYEDIKVYNLVTR